MDEVFKFIAEAHVMANRLEVPVEVRFEDSTCVIEPFEYGTACYWRKDDVSKTNSQSGRVRGTQAVIN